MDWQAKGEENLENLPRFEKFEDDDHFDSYWGQKMPYARLMRWLESQEGVHVDSVFHKFCNLKWLLPIYRTKEQFRRRIELDTFWHDGEICIHDNYALRWNKEVPYRVVKNENRKTIYVHPTTRLVCVFCPKKGKNYRHQWQMERDAKVRILGDYFQIAKIDGIWYFIKGEPQPEWAYGLDRKAPNEPLLQKNNVWQNENPEHPFVKIVLKQQLNNKELRKYGLVND